MDRDQLLAWRDTLGELGVAGLVRAPGSGPDSGLRPSPLAGPPSASPMRSYPPYASLRSDGRAPEPASSNPPQIPTPAPVQSPRPTPAARPSPQPTAHSPQPKTYTPPTDPIACPSPEAVAAAPNLGALESAIQGCMKCPLGPGRIRFVFGEGDPKARMMFVGEGPGRDEDLQGRPFVGKAGELLDKMIGAIGLERRQVYIGNIVKCRPPDNRTPFHEEAEACLGYLRRQIELIQPKVLVTLGATPLRELLGVDAGITKVRGQWKEYRSGDVRIPVMPTFHPAYVLRQYTPDVRKAVWEDLKAAKAWLEKDGMMGP